MRVAISTGRHLTTDLRVNNGTAQLVGRHKNDTVNCLLISLLLYYIRYTCYILYDILRHIRILHTYKR